MLTVHHLGISQSERAVWLCEELGIPYTLKLYARDPVTHMAPPDYKALHPLGTAPIITDGDLTLPETGAILTYIIHKYGNGRLTVGPEAENYAAYLFWYNFANSSFIPNTMAHMVASMSGAKDSPLTARLQERCNAGNALVEARLGVAPYFAGPEFTAADIMMLFPLTTMRNFMPRDLSGMPNTRAYIARVTARPAYQTAMQKGDPGLSPVA